MADIKAFFAGAKRRAPSGSAPSRAARFTVDDDVLEHLKRTRTVAGAKLDAWLSGRTFGPLTPEDAATEEALRRAFVEADLNLVNVETLAYNADIDAKRALLAEESREVPDPSLADAEAEGRRMAAREARAAKGGVAGVGAGPLVDARPKCRLCGDHRRLSEALIRLPDGTEARLCPTCVKQIEWDRERRCISCGSPTRHWTPGGVCEDCHAKGTERLRNIEELRRKRWVLTTGDFIP